MIHFLTLGHLDVNAVQKGLTIILRKLDMALVAKLLREVGEIDSVGNAKLGGLPVEIEDGFVVCPWLMPGRIRETEQFARRLSEETGCLMADFTNRRIVTADAFAEHYLTAS